MRHSLRSTHSASVVCGACRLCSALQVEVHNFMLHDGKRVTAQVSAQAMQACVSPTVFCAHIRACLPHAICNLHSHLRAPRRHLRRTSILLSRLFVLQLLLDLLLARFVTDILAATRCPLDPARFRPALCFRSVIGRDEDMEHCSHFGSSS